MAGQIRDISALHPAFQPLIKKWLTACAARGITLLVIETARSWEIMEAYYARGRKSLLAVNALYKKAGLRPITAAENRFTVTNALPGKSWHYLRLALDAAPVINGVVDWVYNPKDPKDYYDEMGEEAKKLGLIWGGTFRTFPDRVHIEFHPGYSTTAQALAMSNRLGHLDIPLKGVYGDKGVEFPV